MAFISTVPEAEASDAVQALYETAQASSGYIPNYSRLFSHRPAVMAAWGQMLGAIKTHMSPRRYELVTIAAARQLGGSYCMLAHGNVLLDLGVSGDQLEAIARDYHNADLSDEEVAIMAFAEKMIVDATSITQEDVDQLRAFGLKDAEIFDIVLATNARSFFSKTIDALSAKPDPALLNLDENLLDALMVGRKFEIGAP